MNLSEDPGIKYSLIAGNINAYQIPDGKKLKQVQDSIVTRLGAYILEDASDAVVSIESMQGVADNRKFPVDTIEVSCHHMVYYTTRESLKAVEKNVAEIVTV